MSSKLCCKGLIQHISLASHHEVFGQSAFARFLVKRRNIVSRLFHNFNHTVERNAMPAIRKCRVEVRIQCACGCKGISFYAWYLHQAAHRVASHAQMVFQSHLCGILNLSRTATKQLACGSRSHSTSHANLTLATNVGTRDRGVFVKDGAKNAGCG